MRVAVVGCGRMGKERARAATSFGVDELLLFDEDRTRAKSLADECGQVQCLNESSELFRKELDALFICVPPYCRGQLEAQAIELGVPFFVEKPIGVTAAQVQSILDRLDRRNVINAVGYMNRYRNSVLHVRQVLAQHTPIGIAAHWIGRKYAVPWWSVVELSGGPFNEQATHLVDLFRFFAGGVEILFATADSPRHETTVLAAMRLLHGGIGSFLYSCEAKEKDILIAVETTDGVLEMRGWDLELVRNTVDGSLAAPESKPIFEKETRAFLTAVRTSNPGLILADFRDAFQTQIAMDAAVAMIRSHQQCAVSA